MRLLVCLAGVILACVLPSSAAALQFVQPAGSPYGYGTEEAQDLVAGDLNGDGRDDLVAPTWGPLIGDDPGYAVMLANPNGSLSPAPGGVVDLADYPSRAALGDVNDDGKLDLGLTMGTSVNIYLGNGNGTFGASPVASLAAASVALGIAIGDLNGDEFDDVAVANYDSDNVSVFYSDGDGTFTAAPGSPFSVESDRPLAIAIGDLDEDGRGDIVTANRNEADTGKSISVLLATNEGEYAPAPGSPLSSEYTVEDVQIGHVDDGPTLDLVTVSSPNNLVVVKLGDGEGGFTEPPGAPYAFPSRFSSSLALADLNGDGRDEVSIPIGKSIGEDVDDTVWVLEPAAEGSLSVAEGNPFPVAPGDWPDQIAAGDFNDDGTPDLATANFSNNISVLLRNDEPQPKLVVEPEWLEFEERFVDTSSEPQDVRIANEGAGTLTLTGIALTGEAADQYELDKSACGDEVLEPGEECTAEVTFAPTEVGSHIAALTVTPTVGPAVEVSLYGSADDIATASISPTSHDFGDLEVGEGPSSPKTFDVENTSESFVEIDAVELTGTDPSQFEISYDSCSEEWLWPEEVCEIDIEFNPYEEGEKEATLKIESEELLEAPEATLTGNGLPSPDIFISPDSWDAGGTPAGTGSGPTEVFTVLSTGMTPLELGTLSIAGADAGDFTIENDGCSGEELESFTECEVEVAFEPGTVGAKSATLSVPSNAGGSPTTAALSGEGEANPGVALTPASHSFGTVPIGTTSAAKAFTLESTGTTPLHVGTVGIAGFGFFKIADDGCGGETLDPGETCVVEVTFSPEQEGLVSAELQVASDAPGSPESAELRGTGTTVPGIATSPATLEFGDRLVGSGPSATQNFKVESTGTGNLLISDPTISSGDPNFKIVSEDCPGFLEPGQSCTVQVAFEPTSSGAKSAFVQVSSNAGEGKAALRGNGLVRSLQVSPTSAGVSPTPVGSEAGPMTVLLSSTGNTPVTVEAVEWTAGDSSQFKIVGDDCVGEIAASASCSLEVNFAPTELGAQEATLAVSANAPGGPWTVVFSGTGTAEPELGVAPGNHDFGGLAVGAESPVQTFTVESAGATPVTIGTPSLVGSGAAEFAIVDDECVGETLAVDGTCTIGVRFAPSAIGDAAAELQIPSDAAGSPDLVGLEGEGLANPGAEIDPESLSFGELTLGTGPSAAQTATIESTGTTPVEVGSVLLTGPGADQFEYDLGDCAGPALDPGESCELSVVFVPTAVGGVTASLALGTNGPDLTVSLSGTGVAKPVPPPPVPPAPNCTEPQVGQPSGFVPRVKNTPNTLGVRARFPISAPTVLEVSAKIRYRLDGKTRTAALEKRTISAVGPTANYKAALPARLREKLAAGAKVTLKLTYRVRAAAGDCTAFGPAKQKSIATRVVWVDLPR